MSVIRLAATLGILSGAGMAACSLTGEIHGDASGGPPASGGSGNGGAPAGFGGSTTAGFPPVGSGGTTGLPSGGSAGTPGGGSSGDGSGGTPAGGTDPSGGSGGDTNAGGASGSTGGSDPSGGSGGSSAGTNGNGGTGGSSAGTNGNGGSGGMTPSTLGERITKTTVTVAAGVKAGVQNWSIWGRRNLVVAPVYSAPLAGCETLVCFTSGSAASPTARIVRLSAQDQLVSEVTAAGFECRGVAAGAGGQFAALLWDDAQDDIWVRRYNANGSVAGSTQLVNADNNPTDFGIGESRLEFGGTQYGAYYHVHSNSGHEGDTMKWVNASTGAETTEWNWGCSHSMSNVLRYNPALSEFMPACVTDCFPGTGAGEYPMVSIGGIYLNHNDEKVMDVDAGCNGSVAGELGSAALSPTGWKLIFNAHQAPVTLGENSYNDATMNQDVGFSSITGSYTAGNVVWLTNTPSIDEMDSSITRFEPAGSGEQYLVGWVEGATSRVFKMALLGPNGTFIEAPITVTNLVQWGRRDDPFRTHYDGDVVWAWFDSAGSTTLNIGRVDSGLACQ